jgi:non-specific serine/threonine protein kinase
LIGSSTNLTADDLIAPLSQLRGQILFALDKLTEAEAALVAAKRSAQAEGERPLLWRVWANLGRVYQRQSRRNEAATAFRTAQQIVDEIAVTIDESPLREDFLKGASAWIPRPSRPTSLQDAKREFGGLTRREREVAAMIAAGKTNREIAETLVVSTRTVETHVENVLTRLGFSSRSQIAAWAVEKGLRTPNDS